jgi:hypothetical protein
VTTGSAPASDLRIWLTPFLDLIHGCQTVKTDPRRLWLLNGGALGVAGAYLTNGFATAGTVKPMVLEKPWCAAGDLRKMARDTREAIQE